MRCISFALTLLGVLAQGPLSARVLAQTSPPADLWAVGVYRGDLYCPLQLLAVSIDTTKPAELADSLVISLAHNSPAESRLKTQLERLVTTYSLKPWFFTNSILIDQDAIPHSHPTLTLHTRHIRDDDLLVTVFVHEQFHWYLTARHAVADSAVAEIRTLFPSAPTGFPEGSGREESTYAHFLVIALEYQSARLLLGELRARQAMEFWATDHYTAIYRAVLDHTREVEGILKKYSLASPGFRYRS